MVNPAAISSALVAVAKFIESVKIVLESVEKSGGADAVSLMANGCPCHGVTLMGATPDHGILSEGRCQSVGMVDIGRPLTTPLIEVGE